MHQARSGRPLATYAGSVGVFLVLAGITAAQTITSPPIGFTIADFGVAVSRVAAEPGQTSAAEAQLVVGPADQPID